MPKRFQTWFGIPIPPFKEQKYGASSTTIRFVIHGTIPSKKNNQQSVTVRKIARDWAKRAEKDGKHPSWADVHTAISMVSSKMRGNAKYNDFVQETKPIIQEQMRYWAERLGHKGLTFPLIKSTMTIRLYFKGRHITDTVNKQQTIQDLLVECGVIANDDYKSLNPIIGKSACFFEEIIKDIAFISITTNIP